MLQNPNLREDFLHFLWRTRRFDAQNLRTNRGETVEILDFGEYNADAGADFQNARIRINDVVWVGSVEMHVRASDWLRHRHDHDDAYGNVILHVVYDDDAPIFRPLSTHGAPQEIPCLPLKNRIPENLIRQYWALMHNELWIPCQNHLFGVSAITKNLWFERLLIERLEIKTTAIAQALARNKNDWEETFWQMTARYFGAAVNVEPFERVGRGIPHLVLAKHKNHLFQIEALLFGQAGLLNRDFKDDYPKQLQREFRFLRHKHGLEPIEAAAWKFSKMRPNNFPTVRLAQLAQLIHRSQHLFSQIIENPDAAHLAQHFDVGVSDYWRTHYVFDTPSVAREKKLGKSTIDALFINVIAPFLFLYGAMRQEQVYKTRAIALLESLTPEQNAITEGWERLGVELESAAKTQSLIYLKKNYCEKQRCLQCAVGNAILKKQE